MTTARWPSLVLTTAILILAACGPQGPGASQSGATGGDSQPSGAQKTLVIGATRELKNFARFTGAAAGGGSPGSGNQQIAKIAHNYLAVKQGNIGGWAPQVAIALPSVEDGTWRVNPDGTMDTTWKLRSDVKWQDGTPFTAEDMVFGLKLFSDPDYPVPPTERVRQMQSGSAPDPHTFVIHWSTTVASGAEPTDVDPMPRHLLEEVYRGDKQAVLTSPLLTSEFVGLGPFRVAQWTEGVSVEFRRFDGYYLGPAPLDRVIVRYVADANALLANILAGSVHVVLAPSIEMDTAAEVKARWEGTGNQVLIGLSGSQHFLRPQFRPEMATPRNGSPVLAVRRALSHGIDRAALVQGATDGLAVPSDSWVAPSDPLRAQLESAIPQYPYDLARAQQLLSEAGWVRGSDGVLVDQATGERFESKITARPATGTDRELAIIADGWKPLGIQVEIYVLSPALAADRRTMGTQPMALLSSFPGAPTSLPPIHSALLANDANRWTGTNFQGYSNPRVDTLFDQIVATIDERQQVALHRQLLQEAMGDVALMPLIWEVEPVLVAKGVTGVKMSNTYNIFEWDKK
jgi:peptide/nickel transport system substrate-binding protein